MCPRFGRFTLVHQTISVAIIYSSSRSKPCRAIYVSAREKRNLV